MDGNVKGFETREYLKLCRTQWRWILDNYDRLIGEGYTKVWSLKYAYFDEYDLDEPKSSCYLCELVDYNCQQCPLSGIAWRKDSDFPCDKDLDSIYRSIATLLNDRRHEEAKDAIKQFLSIIDNECRRW